MISHTEVDIPGKSATCSESGLTAGKKCSVCGTFTVEQEVIDPTGNHNYGSWVIVSDATCESTGVEKRTCTICKVAAETRDIPIKAHTEEEIPPVAATCTTAGYTQGKKCAVCGQILEQPEYIAPNPDWHKYISEYVSATCGQYGHTNYTCDYCGNSYTEVDTNSPPTKAHTPGESYEGSSSEYYCSVCGEVFSVNGSIE
jgi:hypothetical protein